MKRLLAGDSTLYFGSVRFFKNLIFVAVCVLILTPTLLAVKFYHQAQTATREVNEIHLGDDVVAHSGTVFEPEDATVPADRDPAASEDAEPISDDPPAYQALYPDFYAPQPYSATERIPNTVYLTFDDGPSARTDDVLAVLAEKNVKATFFVTGKSDEADLERMRKIVQQGHTIGMHSYTHNYSQVYTSVESFLDEFHRNFLQIYEATGVKPTVFRFPGGSINGYDGGFYQEIISEMIRRGFVPFDWNISSEDAASSHVLSVDTLVNNVVQNAEGKVRCFVLFHDSVDKVTSAQAVGPVVDQLRGMGFEFAAILPNTLPVLYNYTR